VGAAVTASPTCSASDRSLGASSGLGRVSRTAAPWRGPSVCVTPMRSQRLAAFSAKLDGSGSPNQATALAVRFRLFAVAVASVVFAGCNGGTVDRHALTNDSATLDSIACEGSLLASDVSQGKTTTYYAREQAEELQIQSSNLADALATRRAVAAIERKVRKKSIDAARLAAILGRLHGAPSNRHASARIARQLKKLGGCS